MKEAWNKVRDLERKKIEELAVARIYDNLKFYQVLNLPENNKRREAFEERQRISIFNIIKNRHKHLIPESGEIFAAFMVEFFNGEVKSFAEYMRNHPETFPNGVSGDIDKEWLKEQQR